MNRYCILTSLRNERGMSLIEGLVAVTLGMLVTTGILTFNRHHSFAMQDQVRQVDLQTTARSIVDLFAREVRRTGMDPTCAKTFGGLSVAKDDEIGLLSDLDGSGAIDQPNEDLHYRMRVSDKIVERTAGETESLLSGQDLTGSRFRYFDAAGAELVPGAGLDAAQRAAVRRVRIEVALGGRPADPNKGSLLVARTSTDVDLRNRFFIASTACL